MKHTIRSKDGQFKTIEKYGRALAVKAMCTECAGWGEFHPKDCTDNFCPLFPYRGKSLVAYESVEV